LEALAKAGKLGAHATPAPEDPAAAGMLDLARALSTTPISSELVALTARGSRRRTPPSVAGGPGLAPPLVARSEAPQPAGRAPQPEKPAAIRRGSGFHAEGCSGIELSDERQRSAERSQEVEGLRAALGLRIEEPA
jgi:hypothetical protein